MNKAYYFVYLCVMETEGIIYALYCPTTMKPVYIGCSTQGLSRPFDHIKEKSHSIKVNQWVHILHLDGLSPIVVVLEKTNNLDMLFDKESFWIAKYLSEGNILLNQQKTTPVMFDFMAGLHDKDNPINDISIFIRTKRKMLKMTQVELSQKAGVALTVVRKLEQGYCNINISKIITLLNMFGGELTVKSKRDLDIS